MGWGIKMNGLDGAKDGLQGLVEGDLMQSHAVVSDVEYAVYVEFGTSRMPANAALRGSIQDTLNNLDSVIANADSVSDISRLVAEDIADGWRQDVWVDTGRLKRSIHVEKTG